MRLVRGPARIPLPVLRPGRAWRRRRWKCARRWSPGMCWARRVGGGTVRYVDSSVERLQVKANQLHARRHIITCNGRAPADDADRRRRRGGRRRALQGLAAGVGPAPDHPVHAPLTFDIVDTAGTALARRLRLSCAHPGRAQLRHLPGQFLRGGGAAAGRFEEHRSHGPALSPFRLKNAEPGIPADPRPEDADYKPLPGVPDELAPAGGETPEAWRDLLGALAGFSTSEFEDRFALATAISATPASRTASMATTTSAPGRSAPCR
jgi:hypothetical protein